MDMCKILGFHSSVAEDWSVLGCWTLCYRSYSFHCPSFWRIIITSSSGSSYLSRNSSWLKDHSAFIFRVRSSWAAWLWRWRQCSLWNIRNCNPSDTAICVIRLESLLLDVFHVLIVLDINSKQPVPYIHQL